MRVYRRLFILFVSFHLIISVLAMAQAHINQQATNAVVDFGFDSPRSGWAVVWAKGETSLFRTDDGGRTWARQQSPKGIRRAYFLDFAHGWVVTDEGKGWSLYRTSDSGRNWLRVSEVPLPDQGKQDVLLDLRFLDDQNGWLLIQTGQAEGILVLKITDGKSIQPEKTIPEPRFMSSFAAPNHNLWFIGMDNQIVKRQGSQWESIQAARFGPGANWFRGAMPTDKLGFIVGQGRFGTILKTEDGGTSWRTVLEAKSVAALLDISFFDSTSGCAVGDSRSLYCTTDGGDHWTEMSTLPSKSEPDQAQEFVRALFLNRNHGYVIRDGGFIYETCDGGKTWRDRQALFQ